MKKIYPILAILAAVAGFTNCSKETPVEDNDIEAIKVVVYATTDAVTKTTLADDYNVLWADGDEILFVNTTDNTKKYTFTLDEGAGTKSGTFTCASTPDDGDYTVYYPATYDGTNWPAQTYVSASDISGAPMTATATVSSGSISSLSFKNEGGILCYKVQGSKTIKSINVKSTSPSLDVTLDCGDGVALTSDGVVFNIAVPAGEYSNAVLTFTAIDNTVATKNASTFRVTKNKVSKATFSAVALTFKPNIPDGALPGKFTINISGAQVYFSKGNLTYNVTLDTWAFYDNQYDYATGYDSNLISLFTWGYGDWSKVPDSATYQTGDFTDWGAAMDGKYTWRTLSEDEWRYIINHYTCKLSTVCGNTGLVIAPKDKTVSDSYNVTAWATAESEGYIFLPAAGDRSVSHLYGVGVRGHYFSSTPSTVSYAYNLCFYQGEGYVYNSVTYDHRDAGFSVRLVSDCQ